MDKVQKLSSIEQEEFTSFAIPPISSKIQGNLDSKDLT
jgi:hypothetical protein